MKTYIKPQSICIVMTGAEHILEGSGLTTKDKVSSQEQQSINRTPSPWSSDAWSE